jgi:hypothetical protein
MILPLTVAAGMGIGRNGIVGVSNVEPPVLAAAANSGGDGRRIVVAGTDAAVIASG